MLMPDSSHLIDGKGRREPEHEVLAAVEAAEHGGLFGVVVEVAAVERVRQDCAYNKEKCNFLNCVIFDNLITIISSGVKWQLTGYCSKVKTPVLVTLR